MDLKQRMDLWVSRSLQGMGRYPRMYGGVEAFELQVLLLLEAKSVLGNEGVLEGTTRDVVDKWCRLIRRTVPGATGVTLLGATLKAQGVSEENQYKSILDLAKLFLETEGESKASVAQR